MKTAKYIRRLNNWLTDAGLYQLSEPLEGHQHVIVSAYDTEKLFPHFPVIPNQETYIFPSNERGEPLNMLELEGSYKGGLDHGYALKRAGYQVIEE